jgi:hypothetical protein
LLEVEIAGSKRFYNLDEIKEYEPIILSNP